MGTVLAVVTTMLNSYRIFVALITLSIVGDVRAQEICPAIAARFPTGLALADAPQDLSLQQRFELRRCPSGALRVLVFESGKSEPSMSLDDLDSWPRQLFHRRNLLVVQTIGGSSSTVYVLHFRGGKAMEVRGFEARSAASITNGRDEMSVKIVVPAFRRPTSRTPRQTLVIPIEYDVDPPQAK